MVTLESLDKKFDYMLDLFSRKFYSLEKDISDLAGMTARGFLEVNRRLRNVENRLEVIKENYVTKADLASFIQSGTLP